jgi:putative membrane protein
MLAFAGRSLLGLAVAALVSPPAWAQTPVPPAPRDFAMAAAQSDQYEILAGHLAVVQAQDPRVRAFAERMIKDHARLGGDLRAAVAKADLPPLPPAMSSDQAALLSGLQGLRGADFDKAYARQQVLAHTQAALVEDSFAAAGADPTLKKAAQSALPMIQEHLTMAKQLRADLGGS